MPLKNQVYILPSGGLYNPYHLSLEPESPIDCPQKTMVGGFLEAVSSISSTVYMCHRHGVFHAGFFYCSRKKISGLAERGL